MKLQAVFKFIFVLATGALIVSCNDKEEAFDVLGDVYYITRIIDGEVQTGLAIYVFGNKSITSAKVMPPGGGTITLTENQGFGLSWYKEPEIEEYSQEYPPEGTYNFEITSEDGEVLQSSDILEIDSLEIPEFTALDYNTNIAGYNVTWDEIEKAHAFIVKLKNSDGDFIFSGYTVSGETTSYNIIEGGSGQWGENPVDGETYTFQIQAFRFDNDADQSDYIYNYEEISIGETDVVWGE
jgi:hypothetical protein